MSIPIGTPVRYWTGARDGEGTLSRTRSEVQEMGVSRTPVVWVEGHPGCIALTHIEVVDRQKVGVVIHFLYPDAHCDECQPVKCSFCGH